VTAQQSGLYFGTTGPPRSRTETEIVKGVCYCCKTALASGTRGALYAAWRQVYKGNVRDIAFAASRDGGLTFSTPVRVSEDGWEINGCPDDGPAMAVDQAGRVHIVWPTVMVANGALEGALFYASTRDGRTFTKRLRVPAEGSPKPSHPQIAIDQHGRVIVAWDELIGGRRTVMARVIGPAGAARLEPVPRHALLLEAPGAYPVLAATSSAVIAAWTAGSTGESTIAVRVLAPPSQAD
jgi:hypothetical protein